MKKVYLFVGMCLFALGTMQAQERTTLALWDFEGANEDFYAYFVDDEENGTTRAWVTPNEGSDANLANSKFGAYREGDVDGTSVSYYSGMTSTTVTVFGLRCLNSNGWGNDPIQAVRYWYMENISTIGMEQIEVELYLASVGTKGMTQFRFDYKIGDGAWVIGTFQDVRTGCSASSKLGSEAADLWKHQLPAECNNKAKIECRWVSNDTNPAGDPIAKSDGAARVDDVKVSGVPGTTGIAEVKEQTIVIEGNNIVAKADTKVAVYNAQGMCLQNKVMQIGESISLPGGLYIIETPAGKTKACIK